jgi:hypothetical protein
MARHARTRYTKKQVEEIMAGGVRAINGRGPDIHGFARVFQGAVAYSLFSSIHQAFLIKSDLSVDELGSRWRDLKPKTKAYSRMDARAHLDLPGPKYRPTLTDAQDRVWRGIYARILRKKRGRGFTSAKERKGMSKKEYKETVSERRSAANSIAAGAAWIFVKEHMGAFTLLQECQVKIPVNQRTGRLVQSLEPAPLMGDGSYRPINSDQVIRGSGTGVTVSVPNSTLTIGTKVPYSEYVDKQRPLWPRRIGVWMDRATDAGRDAILEHLAKIVAEGAP